MQSLLQSMLPWGHGHLAREPQRLDSVELAKKRLRRKKEQREGQRMLDTTAEGGPGHQPTTSQDANNEAGTSSATPAAGLEPVMLQSRPSGEAELDACPSSSYTASQSANINLGLGGIPAVYVPQLPPSSSSDVESITQEAALKRLLELRPDSLVLAKMRLAKQHEAESGAAAPDTGAGSTHTSQPRAKRQASGPMGSSDPRTRRKARSRRPSDHHRRASENGSTSGGEGLGSTKGGARGFFERLKATLLGHGSTHSDAGGCDAAKGPSKSAKSTHSIFHRRDSAPLPKVRGTSIDLHELPRRLLNQQASLPTNALRSGESCQADHMSAGSGQADSAQLAVPVRVGAQQHQVQPQLQLPGTPTHARPGCSDDGGDEAEAAAQELPGGGHSQQRSSLRAVAPHLPPLLHPGSGSSSSSLHLHLHTSSSGQHQQRLPGSPPPSATLPSGRMPPSPGAAAAARYGEAVVAPSYLVADAGGADDCASFTRVRIEGLSASSAQHPAQQLRPPSAHQHPAPQAGAAGLGAVCEGTLEGHQWIPGTVNTRS